MLLSDLFIMRSDRVLLNVCEWIYIKSHIMKSIGMKLFIWEHFIECDISQDVIGNF